MTDEQMAGLYAACDCLVSPYRGEGFGLPILEAMACGLPVVVTGLGAALDFCDEANAYLVPAEAREFPDERVGEWETAGRPWLAEPDGAELTRILRHVVGHPDEARAKGLVGKTRACGRLTWERAAAAAEARLRDLLSRPPCRLTRPTNGVRPDLVVPGRPMRVSLVMMVKNEEDNLADCLNSVLDLVHEAVVVDTGSQDRTKEIAASFGDKVKLVDFPWIDSFCAARNEGLRHATGDFAFWVDADDRLDDDNRARLKDLFHSLKDENAAYVMKCVCLPDPTSPTATVVDHVRLFRNRPDVRWEHRVHEQILPAVRASGGDVRRSDVRVTHTGYTDRALRRRKLERDLRLLELEQSELGDHPFTLFNLGCVTQELGDFAGAVPLFRRSLAGSHPSDSIVRKLYSLLAQSLDALGRRDEALAACAEGLTHCPDDAELLYARGQLLAAAGEADKAADCFRRLLTSRPPDHFASVADGLRGFKARHNLALACRRLGHDDEARRQWEAALAERPDFGPALWGLGVLHLDAGRVARARDLASRLEALPGGPADGLLLRARCELAAGDHGTAMELASEACRLSPDDPHAREVLADALLRDGRDPHAAASALREVLRLAPGHAGATRGLESLGRSPVLAGDALFAGNVALAARYQEACTRPSELREHLPFLYELARGCPHVTDVGTGRGTAATALLYAAPEQLVCHDTIRYPEADELARLAGPTRVVFHQRDVLFSEVEETDLLFLDTTHTYEQLAQELRLHGGKVRKYVVVHGTGAFAERGEDPGTGGLGRAVEEFVARGTFRVREHRPEGIGLTVLEAVRPLEPDKKE